MQERIPKYFVALKELFQLGETCWWKSAVEAYSRDGDQVGQFVFSMSSSRTIAPQKLFALLTGSIVLVLFKVHDILALSVMNNIQTERA